MSGKPFPNPLRGEAGIALVLSFVVLLVLSLLALGVMVTTLTETQVASVQLWDTQALFIAEAGIEEAIQRLNLQFPTEITVNGETFNAAIRDTGSLDSDWAARIFLCVYPPPEGPESVEHTATIQHQSDWLGYSHATNEDLALTIQHKLNGDGTVATLDDEPINVIAVSGREALAKREISAEVYPERWRPNNAVLSDGPMSINGNPTIDGTSGSVHTNEDLTITGNPYISENATASGWITIAGNPTIGGDVRERTPEQWIPHVRAADYRDIAEYVLTRDGAILDSAGYPVFEDLGWKYSGQKWQVSGNSAEPGVYYVEGNAKISGNPGDPDSPWETTIIAEGWIQFSGTPFISARSGGILLVAQGDANQDGIIDKEPALEISGNPTAEAENYDGALLSAGNFKINGDPCVEGCVVSQGECPISGDPTITYNGTRYRFPYVRYQLSAWREK